MPTEIPKKSEHIKQHKNAIPRSEQPNSNVKEDSIQWFDMLKKTGLDGCTF